MCMCAYPDITQITIIVLLCTTKYILIPNQCFKVFRKYILLKITCNIPIIWSFPSNTTQNKNSIKMVRSELWLCEKVKGMKVEIRQLLMDLKMLYNMYVK